MKILSEDVRYIQDLQEKIRTLENERDHCDIEQVWEISKEIDKILEQYLYGKFAYIAKTSRSIK